MSLSVIVTGSSRGIGKAIALRLARDGFDIIVHCQSRRAEADAVAQAIIAMGRQARVLQFDIAARAAVAAALAADIAQHGCYYGVVCNAGVVRDNAFPAMSGEDWDIVLKTNLDGFYNVLNPLIMPLVRRRAPGRIVTLSSVAGVIGNRGQVNYSAAKAGIIGASKALALELAKRADHRQLRRSWLDRNRHERRRAARRSAQADSGAAARPAGRSRRSGELPLQRRRRVHHATSDLG